jgi:hypothetical protein
MKAAPNQRKQTRASDAVVSTGHVPRVDQLVEELDPKIIRPGLDPVRGSARGPYRNAWIPVIAPPTTSAWISAVPSYVTTDSRLFMCRMTGYSSVTPFAPST